METSEALNDDLKRRLEMLERERATNREIALVTAKQNREAIVELKGTNKHLREELAQLKRNSIPSASVQIEKKMHEISQATLQLDRVKNENSKLMKDIHGLKDKLTELELNTRKPSNSDNVQIKQIRILENKLDKAIIRYNEAQSIKKTYEQILNRLLQEKNSFEGQLSELEGLLVSKKQDYEELILLSNDASHAKDLANAELHKFEQSLIEDRRMREKEVKEKKKLVMNRIEANNKIMRQNENESNSSLHPYMDADGEGHYSMGHNSSDIDNTANAEIENLRTKLQAYEFAFHKIKNITGNIDVNQIIKKFITKEESLNNLMTLTKEQQAKLDQLIVQKNDLETKIATAKYQIAQEKDQSINALYEKYNIDESTDMEEVELELKRRINASTSRLQNEKLKQDLLADELIRARQSVSQLALLLSKSVEDAEEEKLLTAPVTESNIVEVINVIENKIDQLIVKSNIDITKSPGKLTEICDISNEAVQYMSQTNSRVKFTSSDKDDSDSWSYSDRDSPRRERMTIKLQSSYICERQAKKSAVNSKFNSPNKRAV